MCIIAYKPKGSSIRKRTIKNCWQANPDSGGFMFAYDNKLNIIKGFTSFRSFYRNFRLCERRYDVGFVLHFRIATHGKINKENCHPFFVNKDLGFAHNGIFQCVPENKNKSDTRIFCETVLQKLPKDFLIKKEYHILLESVAKEQNSKIAFLTNKGTCYIFNESAGEWSNGCWYSNDGFMRWESVESWGFPASAKSKNYVVECVWCGDYFPSNLYQEDEPICERCREELAKERINYGGF